MNAFEQALSDLHSIRGSAATSVRLQWLQTSLLANMNTTLHAIHGEMVQIRKQQAEALAIQQELLARDTLQGYLEEFIYQSQKLVTECKTDSLPPPTRYFLLQAILRHAEKEGIGTAIIRGRDNKAAFDGVVSEAAGIQQQLRSDAEVQQALTWAKQLEDKRRRERRQREAEEEAERDAEQARVRLARSRTNRIVALVAGGIVGIVGLVIVSIVGGCCVLPLMLAKDHPTKAPVNPPGKAAPNK